VCERGGGGLHWSQPCLVMSIAIILPQRRVRRRPRERQTDAKSVRRTGAGALSWRIGHTTLDTPPRPSRRAWNGLILLIVAIKILAKRYRRLPANFSC